MAGNEIGTGDCAALAEAMKHNSTITQLNLERNGLGTRDCTALAEVIKHNLTVRQLDLARNEPCTGDRTALAEAIKHNSTITQLNPGVELGNKRLSRHYDWCISIHSSKKCHT